MTRDDRRHLRWLWGLVVLAVVIRWVSWLRTAAMFDDGPLFLTIAQAMADGDWSAALLHPFHPLYPLATWLAGAVVGDLEAGAALVSVLSGGVAVAAIVTLLRDAFDARAAYAGGALLAMHPFAVEFSSDVQSEGLYMALFLSGAALLWRSLRSGGARTAVVAGLVAGLAYLTRPEGAGLALVGVGMAAGLVARGRWSPGRALRWSAALTVGVVFITAPYVVGLRLETGEWMLTQKKSVAQLIGLEADSPAAASRSRIAPLAVLPRSSDADASRATTTGGRWLDAVSQLYLASVSSLRFVILVFLLVGLWHCRGRPGLRGAFFGTLAVFYAVVLLALGFGAGYVSRRHALPPLLPLLGYAAVGVPIVGGWIVAGADRLRGRHQPPDPAPAGSAAGGLWTRREVVALSLGLLIVAVAVLPRDFRLKRPDRLAERRAAEWLQEQRRPAGPVAAGRPRVAYYAGERFVPLPSAPEGGMLRYLRGHGARYVIVDEGKLDEHHGLREARGRGLRMIHRVTAEGRSAAVFEVEKAPAPVAVPSLPEGRG